MASFKASTERFVVVASRNPAKISAATAAVKRCFPKAAITFKGLETDSGVPDQPVGDDQTLQGAVNRIRSIQQQQHPEWPPDTLYIAIEGGVLLREGTGLHCFAWAAAAVKQASSGKISSARSAEFLLPQQLSRMVLEDGLELGAADDALFRRSRSGQGSGTVGHLTSNAVTRAHCYEHTITMALIPYMNPQLYPEYL